MTRQLPDYLAREAKIHAKNLAMVMEWAVEGAPDWFDDTWVNKIYIDYTNNGYLTESQAKGLQNIIDKFKVEDWAERTGFDMST